MEKFRLGILIIFLLLFPTQLGRHFWFEWSSVLGIRIDYLSPVLYLSDLIFIFLLILDFRKVKEYIFKYLKYFCLLLVFLAINIIFSQNIFISFYKALKIIEFLLVFVYIKSNKEVIISYLKKIIPIWIIFEVSLSFFQIISNSSLQGIFYWFGERRFNINTIGIAKWTVFNEELLRAYGTFSHPNSLAGFLLVSLVLLIIFIKKSVFKNLFIIFGILGIILTGSRTVIFLGVGYFIYNLFLNKKKFFIKSIFFIAILLILSFSKNIFSGWDKDSWNKRENLINSSIEMFLDNKINGVGVGNFLSVLPEYSLTKNINWIQPVHNIYLLYLVEFGVLGIIFALFILNKFKINFKSRFFIALLIILIIGANDHYWITLQQNNLLFVLVLALI